jgi:ADP-heptose:LPS heptosyltransferase
VSPPLLVGLRALKLGDLCAAVPAWRALRRTHPEHRTVLAAPAWQRPLADLCPAIDELVDVGELRALAPALHGADLAVNLHGRGPESSRLLAASAPGRLVAFEHPDVPATAGGPRWDPDEHEVRRWLRLVDAAGGSDAAPPTTELDAGELALDRPAVPPRVADATIVHPGASSGARRWPTSRWASVARALSVDGHRVVVTGTAGEAALAEAVASGAGLPAGSVVAGRTELAELAALVADARLVLCGDTGIAHLASAYATPSVVLFGPTAPATWGPPADGPHQVLWAGRTGDPHADHPHEGLLAIAVGDVLAATERLVAPERLAATPAPSP